MQDKETSATTGPAPTVRLWPAVVLVALYWSLYFIVGSLDKLYFVGFVYGMGSAGLLVLLCLSWGWTNRRIALKDRWGGFLLIVAALFIAEPFCHPSVGWFGLLTGGLPVVLTVWTLGMVFVKATGFTWYRPGAVAIVALTFAYFTLLRIDGLTSELKGDVRWRWSPSAEDISLAQLRLPDDQNDESRQAALASWSAAPAPGDWAEFRGPDRDGVIRGVTVATDWSATPPRQLWRQRVGPAWSSVIVVGNRLFTQEQRRDKEAVVCYDAETGKPLWVHEDTARFWE